MSTLKLQVGLLYPGKLWRQCNIDDQWLSQGQSTRDIPKVLHPTIDRLAIQLQDVQQRLNKGKLLDFPICNRPPFTPKVLAIPLIDKFKIPSVSFYDGNKDQLENLENFKGWMDL